MGNPDDSEEAAIEIIRLYNPVVSQNSLLQACRRIPIFPIFDNRDAIDLDVYGASHGYTQRPLLNYMVLTNSAWLHGVGDSLLVPVNAPE